MVERVLFTVRVTPNAKEARVTKTGEASFEVKVDEKALAGRANKRLLEILSNPLQRSKEENSHCKGSKIPRQDNRDHPLSLLCPIEASDRENLSELSYLVRKGPEMICGYHSSRLMCVFPSDDCCYDSDRDYPRNADDSVE
jgi:hypothetical protein